MSDLEGQYRAALRWYPHRWRVRNSEALLGTLLDTAEAEGRTAPTREERRDLAVNGVRARVDAIAPLAIRDRAASIALGMGFGLSLVLLYGSEWVGRISNGDVRVGYLLRHG